MARPAGEEAETEDERIYALKPMNCPGPRSDLQARPALLPRTAAALRRVRRGEPLRAIGRAARADARARLHPGRRPYLLHRGAARRRMPQDQRADPVGLQPLRLRQDRGEAVDAAREARRHGRDVGSRRGGDEPRARRDQGASRQRRDDELNPGEGAFYGPKFEYVLRDAIGRDWQCGTTQVDFNLPERFGAFYIAGNSEKTTPVMIHRAICGSMERFIGILLEHFAGHLPLWLAPVQIVVCTITQRGRRIRACVFAAAAQERGLRVETDLRNEKINYKVREHSLAKDSGPRRRRPQGGEREHDVVAPPGIECADFDARRGGDRGVGARGAAAGPSWMTSHFSTAAFVLPTKAS